MPQGVDEPVCCMLCAGTKVEDGNDLREGVDGQPVYGSARSTLRGSRDIVPQQAVAFIIDELCMGMLCRNCIRDDQFLPSVHDEYTLATSLFMQCCLFDAFPCSFLAQTSQADFSSRICGFMMFSRRAFLLTASPAYEAQRRPCRYTG